MKKYHRISAAVAGAVMTLSLLEPNQILQRLQISGATSVATGACSSAYTVALQTNKGASVTATASTPITLTQINFFGINVAPSAVQFYSDADCTTALKKISVPVGAASASFYILYTAPSTSDTSAAAPDKQIMIAARSSQFYMGTFKIQITAAENGDTDKGHHGQNPPPKEVAYHFGFNEPFQDPQGTNAGGVSSIMYDTDHFPQYAALFAKYHISEIRYPGGGVSETYAFNDPGTLVNGRNISEREQDKIIQYKIAIGAENGAERQSTFKYKPGNYDAFLRFAVATGIHPIITLNDMFYTVGTDIYPLTVFRAPGKAQTIDMGVQPDAWEKATQNLKDQLADTHAILPADQNAIWEIGNESYARLPATAYCDVVHHFANTIKNAYPNDKVLVFLSKGKFQHSNADGSDSSAFGAEWNQALIDCLKGKQDLGLINSYSVHYYFGSTQDYKTQADINSFIQDNPFTNGLIQHLKTYFPTGYEPKFSFTEFSPLRDQSYSAYNTQLHALLLIDELMRLHSYPSIIRATKHTGLELKNGNLFSKALIALSPLKNYVDQNSADSDVFAYIPPETEAIRIFYDGTGDTVLDSTLTSTYRVLVTERDSTKYIQLLNYSALPQTIGVGRYGVLPGSHATIYPFATLTSHKWNPDTVQLPTTIATSMITVPAHSFTTIISN